MAHAAVKLESFAPCVIVEPLPVFTQDDLDQARKEGLAEGLKSADNEQVSELLMAIRQLCGKYSDKNEQIREIYAEAMNILQPVLAEIIDALAPSNCSRRLEKTLSEAFEKYGRSATPARVRIICGAGLKEVVERCISDSGLSTVDLEYNDSRDVSLLLSGGRIEISQDRMTREFRKLIGEIMENSTNECGKTSD